MNTSISSTDRFIRLFTGITIVALIILMPVTEAFSEFTSSREFTTGQFLRLYNAGHRTGTDGRVVANDTQVFADFRYSHWPDNYYEWVSVRVNGGAESERTPVVSLQRSGDTLNVIPVNIGGHCGDIEVVLWTGRRNASPVISDPFRVYVDCERPQITIRAFETVMVRESGLYRERIELSNGECSRGIEKYFDVGVRDNKGIKLVTSTLQGSALRQGGGYVEHYDSNNAELEVEFRRDVDAPLQFGPLNDSLLTLSVDVVESSGRQTQQRFSITRGNPSLNNLLVNIERPANRALITAGTGWAIRGRVTSSSCALTPETVKVTHTIPGGRPKAFDRVRRVDGSGRFSIPVGGRTIPVGLNEFRVVAGAYNAFGVIVIDQGYTDSISVHITPLTQNTLDKLHQPSPIGGVGQRQLIEMPTPAADRIKKLPKHPSAEAIQKKSLGKTLEGVIP